MFFPLINEVPYSDPLTVFAHFSQQNPAIFFDSAELREACGRYSFIGVWPWATLVSKNGIVLMNGKQQRACPWQLLASELQRFVCATSPEVPGFQGGAAGLFSYDLYQHLEQITFSSQDDLFFPDMALGFYDIVLGFDNLLQRAWIVSNGLPSQGNEREIRARQRLNQMLQELHQIKELPPLSEVKVPEHSIEANFSCQQYQVAVQQVIDYILAGDIFEANIAQRFKTTLPAGLSPFALYCRLRLINPAPFAAYLRFNETVIASASPERFLKLNDGKVEARPIKGTRPRGKNLIEDATLAMELKQSDKDQAENVMIVDLLRNDLSRVCKPHSVTVPQLCGLESYATVHHLVSVVQGQLAAPYHAVDLLRAAFPGGSITGAPKIRAMEIIAEIEPTRRGPYCGSIGYIGLNGAMDSSILIRSFAIQKQTVTFQAGGAIVIGSSPLAEYEETLIKAKALHEALTWSWF